MGMAKSGLAMFYADFFGYGRTGRILWNSVQRSDISWISLLNLGDDCLHGEIQPFVEGYRSISILVHGGEHVFPVLVLTMFAAALPSSSSNFFDRTARLS